MGKRFHLHPAPYQHRFYQVLRKLCHVTFLILNFVDVANKKQSLVAARVNGILWDLTRPLNHDCDISPVYSEDLDGQRLLWHSSAHVLASAVEDTFPGTLVCTGPVTSTGFFYDVRLPDGKSINKNDCAAIETGFETSRPQSIRLYV